METPGENRVPRPRQYPWERADGLADGLVDGWADGAGAVVLPSGPRGVASASDVLGAREAAARVHAHECWIIPVLAPLSNDYDIRLLYH